MSPGASQIWSTAAGVSNRHRCSEPSEAPAARWGWSGANVTSKIPPGGPTISSTMSCGAARSRNRPLPCVPAPARGGLSGQKAVYRWWQPPVGLTRGARSAGWHRSGARPTDPGCRARHAPSRMTSANTDLAPGPAIEAMAAAGLITGYDDGAYPLTLFLCPGWARLGSGRPDRAGNGSLPQSPCCQVPARAAHLRCTPIATRPEAIDRSDPSAQRRARGSSKRPDPDRSRSVRRHTRRRPSRSLWLTRRWRSAPGHPRGGRPVAASLGRRSRSRQ